MTQIDIPVRQVLEKAAEREDIDRVLVIGHRPDNTFYIAASTDTDVHTVDVRRTMFALERGDEEFLSGEKAIA